ncbi:MAG: phosphoglucosamine mutase [Clostridia bacterium]|nr:phosphoglucosamine mutase [Clostridia bacterium]
MGRLFGTDGIRGVANELLTCERALTVGRATANVLLPKNKDKKQKILIGMDTRLSSAMLASALASGICSVGIDVVILGVIPTPAEAYLVRKYGAAAGIMISASHNSAEFNGIKIFNSEGYKLADELEERIESVVLENTPPAVVADALSLGNIVISNTAVSDYVEYVKSTTSVRFDGLEIAIDCANGSSSATAEQLFTALGAKCHMLHDKPDGLNINRDCGSTHMESLRDYVIAHKLDAGLAFDGDADRFLCVDNNGTIIDGDVIMAVMALDMKNRGALKHNTVVGTIMTNFGFNKFCEENGIGFVATKVGDRYVLEQMLLEDFSFGGEQSGHLIMREYSTTGDGQLTAVQLLSSIVRAGRRLSELSSVMKKYPQTMKNIKVSAEAKLAMFTDENVKAILEEAKAKIGETGRLVVRPSGTEPLVRIMAEGEDEKLIREVVESCAERVEKALLAY